MVNRSPLPLIFKQLKDEEVSEGDAEQIAKESNNSSVEISSVQDKPKETSSEIITEPETEEKPTSEDRSFDKDDSKTVEAMTKPTNQQNDT